MRKSRILWILWLALSFLFWAVTESAGGCLLFLVSAVLPPVCALPARRLRGKLEAEISASAYCEKNQEAEGKLTVRNSCFLPADRLICQLCCENLLTGEKELKSLRMAVPARASVSLDLRFMSRHAGRVRMSLKQMTYFDLFGLFRFRNTPVSAPPALTLAAPNTFPVVTQISYGESANMDSDEYSMKKAGYDPSETFAIREYRPGDRIRQIHWKLTEKLGSLTVRDYGLPIQNTILLLLETGWVKDGGKPEADCLDALAEAILSVSQELVSQQTVHSIGWQNHEENTFSCEEVETEDDLNSLLPGLLGASPGEDELSVAEHYMANREQLEFAHVVVFTPQHRESLSYLAGHCLLTEVICEQGASGYDQKDGIAIIGAVPEQVSEMLAYIEI